MGGGMRSGGIRWKRGHRHILSEGGLQECDLSRWEEPVRQGVYGRPPTRMGGRYPAYPSPPLAGSDPLLSFLGSLQNDRFVGMPVQGPAKTLCNIARFPKLGRGVSDIPPHPFIFKTGRPPPC